MPPARRCSSPTRDPNHAAVAVNEGLLRILDRPEVEGVIAHEIAHIKNRDTLTMTVVATIVGAIMMIAKRLSVRLIIVPPPLHKSRCRSANGS